MCIRLAILSALWLAAAAEAATPKAAPKPQRPPQAFLLLVSGNPGSPVYARRFDDWLNRWHAYATGPAGLAKANVVVLSGDKNQKNPLARGLATAAALKSAIAEMADKLMPDDQFVLVLLGHATMEEAAPMLLLEGPDLSAKELADALEAVPAKNQVVLNFTAAAGDFVKSLARDGRVNVAATGPGEEDAEPVLCEFFLRALESKHGPASVLDVYNGATRETAMWIARQKKAEGDEWVVEGQQSVAIFKKLCTGDEKDPGARKLSSASDDKTPDAVVPLKMQEPKEGQDIEPWWIGRRNVLEHAVLEDCGQEVGVSCLQGVGYEAVDGTKEGQPGWRARRVILGRPDVLPAQENK